MAEIRRYGDWTVHSAARKISRERVANYMESYVTNKMPVLSPNTVNGYDTILRLLKKEYNWFWNTVLWDVGRAELQALVNEMKKDGRSPKYIRNVYGLVTAVLRENDIPVPKVTLPQQTRPDLFEPTISDIREILKAVRGTRLEIPVLFALNGLRQGEICALRYPKDFRGRTVHVAGSIARNADGQPVRKAPKTTASDRYVRISQDLLDKVASQGFVTDYSNPCVLSHAFGRFVRKNNLPQMRFHDIRHFWLSYLHQNGIPDQTLQKLCGWETDSCMKRVYRYALEDDTAVKLDSAIARLADFD